ncbi:MAG: anti-sigma factor domain-containing protein, partial [Pseudonocardiaceae bacterium]
AHLVDCQVCAQIVSETERVGASLGLSIPQSIPSAGLEQRVLAVVNTPAVAPVIPLAQRGSRFEVGTRAGSRVLAAAAAVILMAASVVLGIRVVQLDGERDRAISQFTDLSEVIQGATDPAADLVSLATEDGRSIGVVFAGGDQVALLATGLPVNRTTEEQYYLWGLGDGPPKALKGFDVAPDAPRAVHLVDSVPRAGEFTGYAISLEQGRHTPAVPTVVKANGQVES